MSSRRRAPLAWLAVLSLYACGSGGNGGPTGPRARQVIDTITAGDADLLRDRPRLVTAKYALMATDAFAFFRGSLALFLADWDDPKGPLQPTTYPAGGARPLGLGDAHPENFGLLRDQAGNFRLEPNDLDTADRIPYLWDVRRFAVGMCLAARLANATDSTARATTAGAARNIVRAAVASYTDTIRSIAAGAPPPVIEDGGGNVVLEDLFTRAVDAWQNRNELDDLTTVDGGVRSLLRGPIDPATPDDLTRDLPARSDLQIAGAVATYQDTLVAPPPVTALAALDAVQEFGRGVGSLPRVRALVLTRGPTTDVDDDVILEVKELPPQNGLPLPGASTFATPQARLLAALAAGFSEPGADPLWGVGTWAGFAVQIRSESAGFKTVRVDRLEGALGTPNAVEGLGITLASLIARMHAAPVDGASLASVIGGAIAADPDGFADEQTDVALGYCDQVLGDWNLFQQAVAARGPTLGVSGNPGGVASAQLRAMFDPGSDPDTVETDPVVSPLTFNELSALSPDFVELLNSSPSSQSIAGYAVADADSDGGPRFEKARAFPDGTALAAGARVVVGGGFATPEPDLQADCGAPLANCYQAAWDISAAHGETMFLLSPDGVIIDRAAYPANITVAGQSWGRLPDGTGPFSVGAATPGLPNTGP